MNKIDEFLLSKKGYLKKGPETLQKAIIKQLDIYPTIEECKKSLKYIKELLKKDNNNDIPSGFEVKSKWQNANGEWLMSLKPIKKESDIDIKREILKSFEKTICNKLEFNYVIKPNDSTNDLDLKVWMSDKHIGASGWDNNYTKQEIKKRIDIVFDKIVELYTRNNQPFKSITIADLGDALDGMDSFTVSRTHKLKQNMNNIEAFETYLEVHKYFFDKLFNSGMSKTYNTWFITNANHDGDFGYVAARAIMTYINGVYPEVNILNFPEFMNLTKHEGIYYVLTHGKDKENRYKGLPLFPNPQTETFIESFLKRMDIPRQARVRLIKGDLHQNCSAPCKNIEVYRTVGSLLGSSDWIVDNFELTKASCAFELLDTVTGDIQEGVIKLE